MYSENSHILYILHMVINIYIFHYLHMPLFHQFYKWRIRLQGTNIRSKTHS